MRNFQGTFKTLKQSFICAFSICMTVRFDKMMIGSSLSGTDIEIFKKERTLCLQARSGFRWSKNAEITIDTISFWQNVFISIFKLSLFLSIKSY